MLAVTAAAFLLVVWIATKALCLSSRGSDPLKADWQRHVLASSGYLELGMFDDAALVLRSGRRIRTATKSWARVLPPHGGQEVGHGCSGGKSPRESRAREFRLVDQPSLAYGTRRCEGIESAEAILLRARELHHDNAMIEFNLACYASVAGRFEEAKARLKRAIELDTQFQKLAIDDEDMRPLCDWNVDLP